MVTPLKVSGSTAIPRVRLEATERGNIWKKEINDHFSQLGLRNTVKSIFYHFKVIGQQQILNKIEISIEQILLYKNAYLDILHIPYL